MTLGGESTGGDLVVARSPLVANLLVASLPGGEVTINQINEVVRTCHVEAFGRRAPLFNLMQNPSLLSLRITLKMPRQHT